MDEFEKFDEMEGGAELRQALGDFRASVHAWSDAALSRPRTVTARHAHRAWRMALGWALGCALVAGGLGGGLLEVRHHQNVARIAAQREADRQRIAAEERAREEEELLARVDSDVAQQVPDAMEPLAQLMAEDESR